jgi:hypothetical protein
MAGTPGDFRIWDRPSIKQECLQTHNEYRANFEKGNKTNVILCTALKRNAGQASYVMTAVAAQSVL